MSACKFHPFEKLTDETSYFADSITVMTEEDKRKCMKNLQKQILDKLVTSKKTRWMKLVQFTQVLPKLKEF